MPSIQSSQRSLEPANQLRPISFIMAFADKAVGAFFLTISVATFLYYTTWTLALPFMDKSHPIQAYFPDPYYAVAVPLGLLVLGVSGVTSLIALVMIKSGSGKQVFEAKKND